MPSDSTPLSAIVSASTAGLIGLGYDWLFNPPDWVSEAADNVSNFSKDKEKKFRRSIRGAVGGGILSLAIHIWTPFPCTKVEMIAAQASIISASSGLVMGTGYSFLCYPSEKTKLTLIRALGGGTLIFGLYTWAPPFLRDAWKERSSEGNFVLKKALLSSLNGLLFGLGMSFFVTREQDDTQQVQIWKRPVGGAIIGFLAYLFAPCAIRELNYSASSLNQMCERIDHEMAAIARNQGSFGRPEW